MVESLKNRNWKIYFEWIEGKNYDKLATEFDLSPSTIKEICIKLIPPSIRTKPYLTANQYLKFRIWKRGKLKTRNREIAGG